MEARVVIFAAALLEQEAKTVISIFLALTGDAPRRAFVDAIVGMKLDKCQRERFIEIQRGISSRYAERNKVIHSAWGVSPTYPQDLLWGDSRDAIAMMPDIMELAPDKEAVVKRLNEEQSNLQVWNESDFLAVISRMAETRKQLDDFIQPFVARYFGPH